jgi:hypothetical protein
MAEARREKLRIESEDPRCMYSSTAKLEPNLATPNRENDEPTLYMLRNETDEPRSKKSSTDIADPSRANDRIESDEPR